MTTSDSSLSRFNSFLSLLSVSTTPPNMDAQASSYAPVIDTPASSAACTPIRTASSGSMSRPAARAVANTVALAAALDDFRPLATGMPLVVLIFAPVVYAKIIQRQLTGPLDQAGVASAFDLTLDQVAAQLHRRLGLQVYPERAALPGSNCIDDRARAICDSMPFHRRASLCMPYVSMLHISLLSCLNIIMRKR